MTASLNATKQGCDVAPESASQADSQPACLTGVCLLVRSSPEERSVVAPQNNNLAAAFPLAPFPAPPKPQMVKGNDARVVSRAWRLWTGTGPRSSCHAWEEWHFTPASFFARGGGRGAAFYRAGRYFAHARCRWPFGAKEVTKRRRNKAFSGRKPFTATRAVSSTSSVWERRDALSPIA